jgi:hypothetical protein
LEPLVTLATSWSHCSVRSGPGVAFRFVLPITIRREDPFDLASEAWLFGGTLPMYIYVYIFIIPRAAAREFFFAFSLDKTVFPF